MRRPAARNFPVRESNCIPAGVSIAAYSMNFTVTPHPSGQQLGYLTVWPQGSPQPFVSTLNNPTATVVANAAIVPAGSNGGIAIYAFNSTDLIAGINGYFAAPGQGGVSFYSVAPCRAFDSRANYGQPFTGDHGEHRGQSVRAAQQCCRVCFQRDGGAERIAGISDAVAGR
jgi:hypothetical protein